MGLTPEERAAAKVDRVPGPKPRKKDQSMVRNPEGKGGYTAGAKPGPGRGHRKSMGDSILADMRQAYTQGSKPGDPPGVVIARKMLTEDYKGFMQLYVKLAEQEGGDGDAERVEGPKAAAARELCDRLLSELSVEIGA